MLMLLETFFLVIIVYVQVRAKLPVDLIGVLYAIGNSRNLLLYITHLLWGHKSRTIADVLWSVLSSVT